MADNQFKVLKNDLRIYQIKLDDLTSARLKESAAKQGQEFSTHCREILRFHMNSSLPDDDGEAARVGMAMARIYRAIDTLSVLDGTDKKMSPLRRLVMALSRLLNDVADPDKQMPSNWQPSIEALFLLSRVSEKQVETVASVAQVLTDINTVEPQRRRGRPRKTPIVHFERVLDGESNAA